MPKIFSLPCEFTLHSAPLCSVLQESDFSDLYRLACVLSGFMLDSTNGRGKISEGIREEKKSGYFSASPALPCHSGTYLCPVLSVSGCFGLRNGKKMPFSGFFTMPVLGIHTNGIIHYATYRVWLPLLGTLFSRFIRFVTLCIGISFFSLFHCVDTHILFIHSSTDEHLSCFYL